ncbi:MAG: TIGR03032 family protein [Planctomycetia bacterium]|nr:TIGR03032 family protein [Planctomycetia bacterium]
MTDAPSPNAPADASASPHPMRSQHTSTFPQLLSHFGASVLVTTYQAGRLVILRNDDGVLNTHFRLFPKPMGLALAPHRLALGAAMEIREFHNVPAVAPKLEPKGKHDVAFLPRTAHGTGDVQIHEMAFIKDEVWFVNTRFSCLCTRSSVYSFQPQWRPWFISQLSPEDRCHLNGLCVVDGVAKYVTALGETNDAGGWRKNKRDCGILIDVARQEIVARGLSMPHSPRWYRDRLWLLNSGTGGFGWVDLATGRYESVVELPGFTRGLCFAGQFAFIGLSQVRESAVFSGIPIAERPESERACGVWVVNIDTGEIVAWVKFEDAVQEIFAVEILQNARFPDVVIDDQEILAGSFILPDQALHDVPQDVIRPLPSTSNDLS